MIGQTSLKDGYRKGAGAYNLSEKKPASPMRKHFFSDPDPGGEFLKNPQDPNH